MRTNDSLIGFTRYFALIVGAAFTLAGIAGFLPFFTPQPPPEAPHLLVDTSYGLLLELFPVNIIHNLFHLGVAEYLSLGLNLVAGGFLPVLGTLWTSLSAPAQRQIDFSSAGTWVYFVVFLLTGLLGILLVNTAVELSKHKRS